MQTCSAGPTPHPDGSRDATPANQPSAATVRAGSGEGTDTPDGAAAPASYPWDNGGPAPPGSRLGGRAPPVGYPRDRGGHADTGICAASHGASSWCPPNAARSRQCCRRGILGSPAAGRRRRPYRSQALGPRQRRCGRCGGSFLETGTPTAAAAIRARARAASQAHEPPDGGDRSGEHLPTGDETRRAGCLLRTPRDWSCRFSRPPPRRRGETSPVSLLTRSGRRRRPRSIRIPSRSAARRSRPCRYWTDRSPSRSGGRNSRTSSGKRSWTRHLSRRLRRRPTASRMAEPRPARR